MAPTTRRWNFFPYFLSLVFMLFIGIMVFTWHASKQANPVMLDESGRPRP